MHDKSLTPGSGGEHYWERIGEGGLGAVGTGGRARMQMKLSHTHSLICSYKSVLCKYKSYIICYVKAAIITGDVLLITRKHVQTHIQKPLRAPVIIFPLSGSASYNVFSFDWSFWELQMFYSGNSCIDVGFSGKLYDEI